MADEAWNEVIKKILPSKRSSYNSLKDSHNIADLEKELRKEDEDVREAYDVYKKLKQQGAGQVESPNEVDAWNHFLTNIRPSRRPNYQKLKNANDFAGLDRELLDEDEDVQKAYKEYTKTILKRDATEVLAWDELIAKILPSRRKLYNELRENEDIGELERLTLYEDDDVKELFEKYKRTRQDGGKPKESISDPAIEKIIGQILPSKRAEVKRHFASNNISELEPIVEALEVEFQDLFFKWKQSKLSAADEPDPFPTNGHESSSRDQTAPETIPEKYALQGERAEVPSKKAHLLIGREAAIKNNTEATFDCELKFFRGDSITHYWVRANSEDVILQVHKDCLNKLSTQQCHRCVLSPTSLQALSVMNEREKVSLQRSHKVSIQGIMVCGWNKHDVNKFILTISGEPANWSARPPPPPPPMPFMGHMNPGYPLQIPPHMMFPNPLLPPNGFAYRPNNKIGKRN